MTDQLKRAISAAQTAQANDAQAEATRIASSSAGEQTFDMSETTYKTSHTIAHFGCTTLLGRKCQFELL